MVIAEARHKIWNVVLISDNDQMMRKKKKKKDMMMFDSWSWWCGSDDDDDKWSSIWAHGEAEPIRRRKYHRQRRMNRKQERVSPKRKCQEGPPAYTLSDTVQRTFLKGNIILIAWRSFLVVNLFQLHTPGRKERSINLSVDCRFKLKIFNKSPCIFCILSPLLFFFVILQRNLSKHTSLCLDCKHQLVTSFAT